MFPFIFSQFERPTLYLCCCADSTLGPRSQLVKLSTLADPQEETETCAGWLLQQALHTESSGMPM